MRVQFASIPFFSSLSSSDELSVQDLPWYGIFFDNFRWEREPLPIRAKNPIDLSFCLSTTRRLMDRGKKRSKSNWKYQPAGGPQTLPALRQRRSARSLQRGGAAATAAVLTVMPESPRTTALKPLIGSAAQEYRRARLSCNFRELRSESLLLRLVVALKSTAFVISSKFRATRSRKGSYCPDRCFNLSSPVKFLNSNSMKENPMNRYNK